MPAAEIAVSIVVWLGSAVGAAFVARSKGRSFVGYLVLGILFGPLVTLLVVLLVADRKPVDSPVVDRFQRLAELEALRDAGTISPKQFQADAARMISGAPLPPPGAPLRGQPLRYLPALALGAGFVVAGVLRIGGHAAVGIIFAAVGVLLLGGTGWALLIDKKAPPEPSWRTFLLLLVGAAWLAVLYVPWPASRSGQAHPRSAPAPLTLPAAVQAAASCFVRANWVVDPGPLLLADATARMRGGFSAFPRGHRLPRTGDGLDIVSVRAYRSVPSARAALPAVARALRRLLRNGSRISVRREGVFLYAWPLTVHVPAAERATVGRCLGAPRRPS